MPHIVFILSSLNDIHFRKRVEEFIRHGYDVEVYGFLREGHGVPMLPYKYHVLGTIRAKHYLSRVLIYLKSMFSLAKRKKDVIFFYSSLDIALFARIFIKSKYIYEICDLTETYLTNRIFRHILVSINESCIKASVITIFTSEGFANFFSDIPNDKYEIIPNKVSPDCPHRIKLAKKHDSSIIKIGFVGVIRFEAIYHFIKACCNRRNIEIHLFGLYREGNVWSTKIKELEETSSNILYHGKFSNPQDLPKIYSKIDLLLCTYTPSSQNVIYAEPNKLYEAMYFKCPIIVSDNTFIGEKVRNLDIGFSINAMNEHAICSFLDSLTYKMLKQKTQQCYLIPDSECLDIYDNFFNKLLVITNNSSLKI